MGASPRLRACVVALTAIVGCSDGPFARANPYDPHADFEFELRASRDSAFAVGDRVLFQLISDPPRPVTARLWGTNRPDLLAHVGEGYFQVIALPASAVNVQVFVQLGLRADTASLVVMPP